MSREEHGFSVLLARPEQLEPPALAKVLGPWKGIPFQDAVRLARGCWGVVSTEPDAAAAEALKARLAEAGLESFVVADGGLAAPPPALPLRRLALTPEAFELLPAKSDPGIHAFQDPDAPTGPRLVPPGRVALLAAAAFPVTDVKTVQEKQGPTAGQKAVNMGILMTTGLPIKLGKQGKVVERKVEESDLAFVLDLVLREPEERLRVDAQSFDYSCLGAKKAYNVLANLRTLVGELAARAPLAARSRGTAILLQSRPVREMGYDSIEDLERETRWLLTLGRRS